jgi:hypothetical protein
MRMSLKAGAHNLVFAVCLCAAMCLASSPTRAQITESAVKAAYIYRFVEYVSWPAQSFRTPDEPIVIGVVQEPDIAAELARLTQDRTVHNRRLSVIPVRDDRDLPVHVLYVPRVNSARALRLVETARHHPILIVTDNADGLDSGGVINFITVGDRIQFEVSLEAARRAGLAISARLLAVALRVKKARYPDHASDYALVPATLDARSGALLERLAFALRTRAVALRLGTLQDMWSWW